MSCTPPLPAPETHLASSAPETPRAVAACGGSSLDLTLEALRPLLADPEVTELCINRPCEVFLETRSGWRCTRMWSRGSIGMLFSGSPARALRKEMLKTLVVPSGMARNSCAESSHVSGVRPPAR